MDEVVLPFPDLAVIVLALGAPEEAVDAVRSLLTQDPPVEILVVNSGGGGMAKRLAAHGIDVPVIEREERLFVGAARNVGIRATRAPYVAFLASDCRASPKRARNRMLMHDRGFAAVGSAVVNSHRRNPFAWASHLTLWPWRQPKLKMRGLAFGASYDRRLFGDYGYFREDLRIAEDTDFNGRLPEEKKPVWQPNVRTIHRNPTNPVALLADHFARGARAARSSVEFAAPTMPFSLAGWWRRTSVAFRMSRYTHERDRLYVRMALPIIPLATAAYCLGAQYWILSAGRRHREAPAPVAGMPESDTAGAEQRPVTPTAGADLGIGLPLAATGFPETPNDHPPSFL